jgi:hypothetical protein
LFLILFRQIILLKNQILFEMKNFFWALLFAPFFSSAQQTVVSAQRLFPKIDKVAQFEKALAAHVQKYHSGNKWKWRVFSIESGPDFGGYHITEGPMSWDEIQNRGDLGAAHMADWNTNIAPLLDKQTNSYSVYQPDFSNVALTDYSDWINIQHIELNAGYRGDMQKLLAKMKKAWAADNSAVAVYASSSSGAPGYAIVTRYKNGLKERDPNYRPPFDQTFEKANGAGSWAEYISTVKGATAKQWSELLHFDAKLSSK